jgi:hypothetical protein
VEKTIEKLMIEARQLPLQKQLILIEELARSIQAELRGLDALREELAIWDSLSDEALTNFEKAL